MNMEINVFSKTGEISRKHNVSESIFGIEPNTSVLSQYVHVFRSNQRQGTSKTKTRSEVSGGGAKPWRQKGTGRARHGSRRSPIWVHGGIAHGPQPQSWKLAFPKKMRVQALKSALSLKHAKNKVFAIESVKFDHPSTSEAQKLITSLKLGGRVLFIQKDNDLGIRRSFSNIPKMKVSMVENLCTYDILLADNIIFTDDALNFLEEKYANK